MPAVSSTDASVSAYASITHWMSEKLALRSREMFGSATFTIVMSSSSMNVADADDQQRPPLTLISARILVKWLAAASIALCPAVHRDHRAARRRGPVAEQERDQPAISAGATQRSWAFGIAARFAGVSNTLGRIVLQRARVLVFDGDTSENAITAAWTRCSHPRP